LPNLSGVKVIATPKARQARCEHLRVARKLNFPGSDRDRDPHIKDGNVELIGYLVQDVPTSVSVGATKNHICRQRGLCDLWSSNVPRNKPNICVRSEAPNKTLGHVDFRGFSNVRSGGADQSIDVAGFDNVVIDKGKVANAKVCELLRNC
jgi:hypothetical protein